MVDMDMVNEVASVWVFLDGVTSSHLDTMCIPIRTIDLQKGILKCGLITSIFKFKNPNRLDRVTGVFASFAIASTPVVTGISLEIMTFGQVRVTRSEQGASRQNLKSIEICF